MFKVGDEVMYVGRVWVITNVFYDYPDRVRYMITLKDDPTGIVDVVDKAEVSPNTNNPTK